MRPPTPPTPPTHPTSPPAWGPRAKQHTQQLRECFRPRRVVALGEALHRCLDLRVPTGRRDGGDGEHHSRTGSSKMERFLEIAQSYDCNMNLYTNNCRIFCARMEREVYRLNNGGGGGDLPGRTAANPMTPSDLRFATRVALAALLPALYPLGAIGLLYYGCFQP